MQTELRAVREQPPEQHEAPAARTDEELGRIESLDGLELESLMLNLDASLRVRAPHHFFSWTQGSLQSLVRHELLICALCSDESASFHVESFATASFDLGRVNEIFRQDGTLVPRLIGSWEENGREPVVWEVGGEDAFAESALARELRRMGATSILAHGTYNADGRLKSFFVLSRQPEAASAKHAYMLQLIVPFLHSAWVRTQVSLPTERLQANSDAPVLLTARELEVLKWVYHGKSNIEIGMILAISPLTVKNHVQKILRKLNVTNRTQAVAKVLTLRLLNA